MQTQAPVMPEHPSALDQSESEAIQYAEHCALRDISMTGEFNNPFRPILDSVRYKAYRNFERYWNDEQADLDYEQKRIEHESKL
jgi:hypothetical protein